MHHRATCVRIRMAPHLHVEVPTRDERDIGGRDAHIGPYGLFVRSPWAQGGLVLQQRPMVQQRRLVLQQQQDLVVEMVGQRRQASA